MQSTLSPSLNCTNLASNWLHKSNVRGFYYYLVGRQGILKFWALGNKLFIITFLIPPPFKRNALFMTLSANFYYHLTQWLINPPQSWSDSRGIHKIKVIQSIKAQDKGSPSSMSTRRRLQIEILTWL